MKHIPVPPLLMEQNSSITTHPIWVSELKKKYQTQLAANGLPNRKNEAWKYTDLHFLSQYDFKKESNFDEVLVQSLIDEYRVKHNQTILCVLINGRFIPHLS